ncbi:MAG: DUF3536 domain-containing protein, partial [Nostocales cyanobacterium 94392]|nr:DUF3536 domain-containing protein [Nostocales cyanobacterium 94392]
NRHQKHKLQASEQVDALRLLEMQRHSLLMFTSCGWFFEELSRPEGTQILRYASRAMELAAEVAGVQLEKSFLKRLDKAPSNIDSFRTGAEVYRQLVLPSQISFKQVAAHHAITSLFNGHQPLEKMSGFLDTKDKVNDSDIYQKQVYCYTANELDYQLQRLGSLTLAIGHLKLVSEVTWESQQMTFAVLHLGGWDFHCCIQPFEGKRNYTQLKDNLLTALQQGSTAHIILVMTQLFGEESFNLQNLFAEERHRLMRLLSRETLTRVDQLYTQMYRDNYGILMAFHRDGLEAPKELQAAAEIALEYRCIMTLRTLEEDIDEAQLSWNHLVELEAIANEAKHLRCHLNLLEGKQILERLNLRLLWQLLYDTNSNFDFHIQRLEKLIEVGEKLTLGISLERSQELYFICLHSQILPKSITEIFNDKDKNQLRQLLKFGHKLKVDVSYWLNQLN